MKYIDADKLIAEIRRRLSLIYLLEGDFTDGSRDAYEGLLSWLDTHPEQPVEGLEEEIERVCTEIEEKNPQHRGLKPSGIAKIARHFAEWGATHLKR